jgi:hypothetical protein
VLIGKRANRASDLGKHVGEIVPVAGEKQCLAATLAGEHAVTIELELENPVLVRERAVASLRQHDLDGSGIDLCSLSTCLKEVGPHIPSRTLSGLHFLYSEAGEHRGFVELVARRLDPGIALLDEEPVALALLDLHQCPLAAKLVSLELEQELSFLEPFPPILERSPLATVPHDHSARAVVSLGDHSLEIAVFQRVIFHPHRQALVGDVV